MKASAILAAAGVGLRLKETSSRPLNLPKAFWPLSGTPLLLYSLKALLESPSISEIVIVLPQEFTDQLKTELERVGNGIKKVIVVSGKASRTLSVYEGLKAVSHSSDYVLVHDAARPMIRFQEIEQVIQEAIRSGAAIAAKPIASTVKESGSGESNRVYRTVPRNRLWKAETPQVVRKVWLEEAYRSFFKNPFEATDEAALLESIRRPVELVKLDRSNLKITTGQDLEIAEKMLNGNTQFRIGHGSDIHRLVKGRPFILGGEKIKCKVGPLGHSDGDVLLHAISDAILGAVGMGDIGEYFSDKNKRFKNISSLKILSKVLELARENGWQVENVDCTVHLEKPRLGDYKLKIRKRLSSELGIASSCINIKAKTQEGLGVIGSGEAVACEATVLMKKKVL